MQQIGGQAYQEYLRDLAGIFGHVYRATPLRAKTRPLPEARARKRLLPNQLLIDSSYTFLVVLSIMPICKEPSPHLSQRVLG